MNFFFKFKTYINIIINIFSFIIYANICYYFLFCLEIYIRKNIKEREQKRNKEKKKSINNNLYNLYKN